MKLHINKEEKFVLTLAIIVMVFLFIRGAFLRHEEQAVETSYEAGYSAALTDVVEMTTVVETWEVDGDMHITVELPDGNIHEFISPKALG